MRAVPKRWAAATVVAAAVAVPALAIATAAPAGASAPAVTTIDASGSSAAQDYMLALFAKYSKLHPTIKFVYNPDGGSAGVEDVQQGRSELAVDTAARTASDKGTSFDKLFLDAMCIDVNKANPVTKLSIPQVKNIFLATATQWSQVGGSSGTIQSFGRNSTAGLYSYISSAVLGGKTQAPSVTEETSDGLVATSVAKNPDAVGYVGLASSTTSGAKPVLIGGVSCTRANVKSDKYPLTHWDYAVVPSKGANPLVEQFVKWIETNPTAGGVANKAGAVWKKLPPAK